MLANTGAAAKLIAAFCALVKLSYSPISECSFIVIFRRMTSVFKLSSSNVRYIEIPDT